MKKVISLISLVIALLLVSFYYWGSAPTLSIEEYQTISSQSESESTAGLDTFSLVTFNIGYLSGMTNNRAVDRKYSMYQNHMEKAIHTFKKIRPDFMAFQEIDFDADRSFNVPQLHELANGIPFPYAAQAVNWDKRYVPFPYWPISQQFGKVVSGQAILSRFPILTNNAVTLAKPEENPFYYNAFYLERLAQVVQIKIENRQLVIINVHLEAFHAETRDIQIKEVLQIYHHYAKILPVILCGDFNSTLPGATNEYQKDMVMETLLSQPNMKLAIDLDQNIANEAAYYTFDSENPDRRIDYVFYTPELIQILEAKVIKNVGTISDHLPVGVKFTFIN